MNSLAWQKSLSDWRRYIFDLPALHRQRDALKRFFDDLEKHITTLEKSSSDGCEKLREYEQLAAYLEHESNAKSKKIANLEKERHDFQIQTNMVVGLEKHVEDLTRARDCYIQTSNDRELELINTNDKLKQEKDDSFKKDIRIQALESQVHNLSITANKAAVGKISSLEKRIEDLESEKKQMADIIGTFPTQLFNHVGIDDQRVVELTQKVAEFEQTAKANEVELSEKMLKISNLEVGLMGAKKRLAECEEDISGKAAELKGWKKSYDELNELMSTKKSEVNELENLLSESKCKVSELEDHLQTKMAELVAQQNASDHLKVELNSCKRKVELFKNEYQARCKQNFQRLVSLLSTDLQEALSVPDLGILRVNMSKSIMPNSDEKFTSDDMKSIADYSEAGFDKLDGESIDDNFSVPESMNLNEDTA